MSLYSEKPCPCGSGKPSSWLCDARGIPLRRTCDDCHEQALKTYRFEIFGNPDYWSDEPIEEEP